MSFMMPLNLFPSFLNALPSEKSMLLKSTCFPLRTAIPAAAAAPKTAKPASTNLILLPLSSVVVSFVVSVGWFCSDLFFTNLKGLRVLMSDIFNFVFLKFLMQLSI